LYLLKSVTSAVYREPRTYYYFITCEADDHRYGAL